MPVRSLSVNFAGAVAPTNDSEAGRHQLTVQLSDDEDGSLGNQIWHLKPNISLIPKMVLDLGDAAVGTKTLLNDRVIVESVKSNAQPQIHWVK